MPSVKRSGANATDASESGEGVPEGAHGQGAEERVQVSQNLSLPSNDELEHFRKTDLQAYLKARGVTRHFRSSGSTRGTGRSSAECARGHSPVRTTSLCT